MPEARARFITLEGGDGAGKTTQARRLAEALSAAGHPVLRTREPGGSPGAERIRRLLLDGTGFEPVAEAMLHFAARREHVVRTIWPALAAGITVICDRFADSTLAYQGAGQGLDRTVWSLLRALALGDFAPDLTLVMDVPVSLGHARAIRRGVVDRYEELEGSFHDRVRAAFLAIAAAEPDRCVVIDASCDPDTVFAAVWAAVSTRGVRQPAHPLPISS
ncbi:dTMP kinase [Plastoroseomonas arctica]|uniref:Thymidylate kinase n=1 Tax=Plastoroseomonas arctica TaxID=1509237 RepID=A0AAF1JV50_9PROT|nr:dTMP kinase [Plastoroseomonas arctica]